MGTGLTDRNPTRGWSVSQEISNQHADMNQCCLLLAFVVVSDCVDTTSVTPRMCQPAACYPRCTLYSNSRREFEFA